MQCRRVEPNIVMSSARVVPRHQDTLKLEDDIVNVMRSPSKRSPSKTLKRTTSGPVINVQQQIIIQQQAPKDNTAAKMKSKSPPKKCKKKKKSKKKKQDTEQREKTQHKVQQLLKGNLKKFKKQKQDDQMQKEIQKQRAMSLREMKKLMDDQIRQMNNQRFTKPPKSSESTLPWGINQSKLKDYWSRMLQIHENLERPENQHNSTTELAIKEKLRRHKLGLDFLNSKPEKEIQKIITKQRSKQVLDTVTSPTRIKNNFSEEEDNHLKLYMMYKKEFWRQKQLEEKQIKKIQKERVKQNLVQVDQEAKMYAKSRNASIKSNCTLGQSQQQTQQYFSYGSAEQPNYNRIEKESKELMRSLRQSSYTSSTTKSHSRRASQMKFVEWLQNLPETYLQEQLQQLQTINEQMNSQGFMYKLSEQELYQFLEQFLKERFEQQSKSTLKDKFVELQERFQQHQQQQRPHLQITEEKMVTQEQQEESYNEVEMEQIYNIAATIIQKVWRGYKTRQLVYQYLQYLLQQQEELDAQQQQEEMVQSFDQEQISSRQPTEDISQDIPSNELRPKGSEQRGTPEIQSDSYQQSSPQRFSQQQDEPKLIIDIPPLELAQVSVPPTPTTPKRTLPDPEYYLEVFKLREDTMAQKYCNQVQLLERMLDKKKVSSNSFTEHKEKLDRKYTRERERLMASKNELERVQELFKETIRSTQKDQQFIDKIKHQPDDENLSFRLIFSIRSETEYSEPDTNDRKSNPHQQYGLLYQVKQENHLKKASRKKKVRSFDHQPSLEEVSMKNEEIQTSTVFNGELVNQSLQKSQLHEKDKSILNIEAIIEQQQQQQQEQPQPYETEYVQTYTLPPHPKEPKFIVIEEDVGKDQYINSSELIEYSPKQLGVGFNDRKVEDITEHLVQQMIVDFAEELNSFPLQSLGVLMEWDEESDEEEQQFPAGFQTTLNFIKDYLICFSEYLQTYHMDVFLEQLNTCLGITPVDLLKTISLNDINSNTLDDSQQGPLYPLIKHIHQMEPIIDEEIWNQFNEHYFQNQQLNPLHRLKYYGEEDDNSMRDLEMFHLRMIYEAFNEAVNYVRPYGIRGQPYPWKLNPLKVYCNKTSAENIDRAMGFAIAKMLKWGSFLCGFIPEKIETPQGELIVIEDDYLNQIKEDRLQQMLEYEIQDTEEKWMSYDEEQAEVAVELADTVFEMMLDEAAEDIFNILMMNR